MRLGLSALTGLKSLSGGVVCLAVGVCLGGTALAQQNPPLPSTPQASSEQFERKAGPPRRIPRQQALTTAALDGTVREQIAAGTARPVAGTRITLRNLQTGAVNATTTSGDGVFRMLLLPPGRYEFHAEADGYEPLAIATLALNADEVVTLEIHLAVKGMAEMKSRLPRQPGLGPPLPAENPESIGSYREFRHRLDSDPNYIMEL